MPYNTDITDVRTMSGLGTSTQDFTDARITEIQDSAADIINAKTGRADWSSLDPQWELIKEIENHLASAIIKGYGGPGMKEESERLWLRGMSLLEIVATTMLAGAGADSELIFSSSKYLSYPLGLDENPLTEPHKSTRRQVIY